MTTSEQLLVDRATAAYIRDQAAAAGLTEGVWLAAHFRSAMLSESGRSLVSWYAEHPGLLEDELREAEAANEEADGAAGIA